MSSLNVEETRYREHQVAKAFNETFEWVWSDRVSFRRWVTNLEPLFWINGKPGSGKSTLLKYILRNQDEAVPRNPASKRKHIVASFFFHDRGTNVQKSLDGLLYSILYQILKSDEHLQHVVLRRYSERSPSQRRIWTFEQLKQGFSDILGQEERKLRLFLYIDALDEHDGDPNRVVKFIHWCVQQAAPGNTIKLCFSSRPWTCFIDNFSHYPGFSIHEHTRHDIVKYINGRLGAVADTGQLWRKDHTPEKLAMEDFTSELADKANGVFVWLILVMDKLVSIAKRATVEDMAALVAICPEELEDFYSRIVQEIEPHHRSDCLRMVEILLQLGAMQLGHFSQILACAPCKTTKECVKALENLDYDNVMRRIETAKGLLQIRWSDESSVPFVQFLHQTVKSFASQNGLHNRFLGKTSTVSGENGYSYVAKLSLVATMLWEFGRFGSGKSMYHLMEQGDGLLLKAERTTGQSLKKVLDTTDPKIFAFNRSRDKGHLIEPTPTYHESSHPVLAYAIEKNLILYVFECLQQNSRLLNDDKPSRFFEPKPLLFFANTSDMVQLLLQHGADYSRAYKEESVWARFWANIYRILGPEELDIPRLYLGAGQDPDAICIFGKKKFTALHCISDYIACYAPPQHSTDESGASHSVNLFRDTDSGYSALNTLVEEDTMASHDIAMTRLLLEHGADANAISGEGLTPLDMRFMAGCSPRCARNDAFLSAQYVCIDLLLEYGGCVTLSGKMYVKRFISVLQSRQNGWKGEGLVIYDAMRNPPVLKSKSAVMKRMVSRFDIRHLY